MDKDDFENRAELVSAINSQSTIALLKQHSGSVLQLSEQGLLNAADSPEFDNIDVDKALSQSWSWVFEQDPRVSETAIRAASLLISTVSLGLNENHPFCFATLIDLNIRVVIAPFFGPTVLSDAVRHGVLLVPLLAEKISAIEEKLTQDPGLEILVDLENLLIQLPDDEPICFETHPWLRKRLLLGLDELDELRLYRNDAQDFRIQYKEGKPWLFDQDQSRNSNED